MRVFVPYGLEWSLNVVGYLNRVGEREGYKRAMRRGGWGLNLFWVLGR